MFFVRLLQFVHLNYQWLRFDEAHAFSGNTVV
jgi:hypothetical protein